MEIVGRLHAIPNADEEMIITGDIRANENIALTTVQTLFAREHNRIVDLLPAALSEQEKFDIARQLIIAIQQYITYEEFLPALGLKITPPSYYNPDIDPSISTEFATVGYRAHSMIHGEIESADVKNPDECLDGPTMHECFRLANDLGSLDVFRARDHGIPSYNVLRQAYGLTPISSFMELTGEASEDFPVNDPILGDDPINNPKSLDFIELRDGKGKLLALGSEEADSEAVTGIRRTTLAARLKAIYGTVDKVDSFVGMVSEPHMENSDFGPLQAAMWERQFQAKQSLADIIINNTELKAGDIQTAMFKVAE